jgi:hypothetical protein
MINPSLLGSFAPYGVLSLRRVCLLSALALGTITCAPVQPVPASQPALQPPAPSQVGTAPPAASLSPGIPNLPDVVTVVPFYSKPNETEEEQTKVIIPAEVDGRRGNFVVDLGDLELDLNRTYWQPSPTGGVDTVTDATRLPDHTTDDPNSWDYVYVTVRIGTLQVPAFEDRSLRAIPNHQHANAELNHYFGNYSWVFAPRLGNIGLSVLEPFETIIDYTHHRLVLIRLDAAGHRLASVPAYTPRWSAPLLDTGPAGQPPLWWGVAVRPDNTVDTVTAANNTEHRTIDTGDPTNHDEMLGYTFLSALGVVGFNHRTHQFLLYRTQGAGTAQGGR